MKLDLSKSILISVLLAASGCFHEARPVETQPSEGAKREVVASYYGDEFNHKQTSSGEEFDKDGFTAAHPTLPFGTRVRVTNTANHKSVIVRITDRGPHVPGRQIDLSEAAAKAIGLTKRGKGKVVIEVLKEGGKKYGPAKTKSSKKKAQRR